jgi:hypothetical protein
MNRAPLIKNRWNNLWRIRVRSSSERMNPRSDGNSRIVFGLWGDKPFIICRNPSEHYGESFL